MKKIKIYIFYFVLVIYSLEALLFLFMQEKILSKEDIKNKRIEISKKKGLEFDTRTPEEAFLDFKKNNEDLGTNFYYSPIFASLQTFKNAKKHNNIIPFKGPINSKTLTCANDGKYILVQNDKFGFKNSNHIYKIEYLMEYYPHNHLSCYQFQLPCDLFGLIFLINVNLKNLQFQ